MLRLTGFFVGAEMPSPLFEPVQTVTVRLSRDKYLVFKSDAGHEIYDIQARNFKANTAHWLRQLQSKNWFTAELENACLKMAGVVR